MTTKTKKNKQKIKQKQNEIKNESKNENTGTDFWEFVESIKSKNLGSSVGNLPKSWYDNEPYSDDDFDSKYADEITDGCCPRWNCKNPDGSNVELFDMGEYLFCGHCYTKYYKRNKK